MEEEDMGQDTAAFASYETWRGMRVPEFFLGQPVDDFFNGELRVSDIIPNDEEDKEIENEDADPYNLHGADDTHHRIEAMERTIELMLSANKMVPRTLTPDPADPRGFMRFSEFLATILDTQRYVPSEPMRYQRMKFYCDDSDDDIGPSESLSFPRLRSYDSREGLSYRTEVGPSQDELEPVRVQLCQWMSDIGRRPVSMTLSDVYRLRQMLRYSNKEEDILLCASIKHRLNVIYGVGHHDSVLMTFEAKPTVTIGRHISLMAVKTEEEIPLVIPSKPARKEKKTDNRMITARRDRNVKNFPFKKMGRKKQFR